MSARLLLLCAAASSLPDDLWLRYDRIGNETYRSMLLDRIERLHLKARRAVEGWRHGGHSSRSLSTNIEFVDHKEYAPGDPIRHVDWKVAARSDKLVIRRHQAETACASGP